MKPLTRASRNSSISSTETAEKLLTKFSGFLISCAMPAVSWPSEASFSVCTKRSCAVCKSLSDFASSRVQSLYVIEQARILDCQHRLRRECLDQIDGILREGAGRAAADHEQTDDLASRKSGAVNRAR